MAACGSLVQMFKNRSSRVVRAPLALSLVIHTLACVPRGGPSVAARPGVGSHTTMDPRPASAHPKLVDSNETGRQAESESPLPPLPRVAARATDSTPDFTTRLESPPSPCAMGTGWDGLACIPRSCPKGSAFLKAKGCILCIGDCPSFPEWVERAPWSDIPAPFDDATAKKAVSSVDLGECRRFTGPMGTSYATIGFRPSGAVGHVALEGLFAGTKVGECIVAKLMVVRIPPFYGGVALVGRSFSL